MNCVIFFKIATELNKPGLQQSVKVHIDWFFSMTSPDGIEAFLFLSQGHYGIMFLYNDEFVFILLQQQNHST